MKKIAILGYGSLINLESASRTLRRELTFNDAHKVFLINYQRTWTYWAKTYSINLEKYVKGVFLNIEFLAGAKLNGIAFEISYEELEYLKSREKNYDCTDISSEIIFEDKNTYFDKVFTFVGNPTNILSDLDSDAFIFTKYITIVNKGVQMFGNEFREIFEKTTGLMHSSLLEGDYLFSDSEQQKAR